MCNRQTDTGRQTETGIHSSEGIRVPLLRDVWKPKNVMTRSLVTNFATTSTYNMTAQLHYA